MKSRNNEESIFFFGNEFGKNLRHWKAPNSQPQAFPKDSPSDLCHRRYHFSRVSLEKMCVHGCGMTHLFDLLVPLSLWTDSGGPAWHAHVFIPLWSVLYEKAFVEWFTILFYSHSAGYEMVIWHFYLSEKSSFYLLIVMAAMQQWVTRGNHMISFHLHMHCLGTGQEYEDLRFTHLYLP